MNGLTEQAGEMCGESYVAQLPALANLCKGTCAWRDRDSVDELNGRDAAQRNILESAALPPAAGFELGQPVQRVDGHVLLARQPAPTKKVLRFTMDNVIAKPPERLLSVKSAPSVHAVRAPSRLLLIDRRFLYATQGLLVFALACAALGFIVRQ